MASYIKPILQEFETILKGNLNTKVAQIDSDAPTVDEKAYSLVNKMMPNRFPWVSIFTVAESSAERRDTGDNFYANIPVYVGVDFYGRDELRIHELSDVYNTAIIRAVVDGGGWCLNSVVENLTLVSFSVIPVEEQGGNIIGGCYVHWSCLKVIDPLSA